MDQFLSRKIQLDINKIVFLLFSVTQLFGFANFSKTLLITVIISTAHC